MMVIRNEKYKKIGQKLIRSEPIFEKLKASGVRIAYLESDLEKRKNYKLVFADCTKVSDRYSWCCKYDFFITVYEPNIAGFTEEQLQILIMHELMHCGVNLEGVEPVFYVVPHDIEEFYEIIDRFGMEWYRKEDEDA